MAQPKTALEYHRKLNFLSQREVANHLGISQAYYWKLERNPENISLGMAAQLKCILKVKCIDELLGDVG